MNFDAIWSREPSPTPANMSHLSKLISSYESKHLLLNDRIIYFPWLDKIIHLHKNTSSSTKDFDVVFLKDC